MKRIVANAAFLLLAVGLLARPTSAGCPAGKKVISKEPIEVSVDVRWADAPNSAPDDCTFHGSLIFRVESGSLVHATFTFEDGDVVIMDWGKQQTGGKYGEGVVVDYAGGKATFKKRFARGEMIVKRLGRQTQHRFERLPLLAAIDEEDVSLLTK